MEPFPKVLVRIGGHSFDAYQKIKFSDTKKFLESIESKRFLYQLKREELSNELLNFIQSIDDKLIQNALLNIRRNIHNGRPLKNKDLKKTILQAPKDLIDHINEVVELKSSLGESIDHGSEIFTSECLDQRKSLQGLLQSEILQKGLILSSKSLLDRIDGYINKNPEQFRKREYQNEIGFSQYLTRIHTKTSPFSTFTNLTVANLEKLETSDYIASGPNEVNSHIRLNNGLLRYIKSLLKEYSEAFPHLMVNVNPTISEQNDKYKFLTNNRNIESFQEVDKSPLLDEILKYVSIKQTLSISGLMEYVVKLVDCTDEELQAYLKQVINSGLLEYHFKTSGTDPNWTTTFIPELSPLKTKGVPHIEKLIDVLKEVESISSQYAASEVPDRIQLNKLAFEKLKDVCITILEASELSGKKEDVTENNSPKTKDDVEAAEAIRKSYDHKFFFKPEQIFYEDSTRDIKITLDEIEVSGLLTKVDSLLQELKIYQGYKLENQKMKKYFFKKYSSNSSVPVIKFYEDYYRDVKALEKAQQNKGKEEYSADSDIDKVLEEKEYHSSDFSSLIVDEQKVFNARSKAWFKSFSRAIDLNYEGEIYLALSDFKKVNGLDKVNRTENSRKSYGAFIQFFTGEDDFKRKKLKACLNSSFAGYGKMMSRFIHLFDEDFKNQIRKRNEKLQNNNELFAENCDATYFNANLHPTLMPYEIWAPGSNNNLAIDKQLRIVDLDIGYSEETEKLEIIHRISKKNVMINDLGFQSIKGRSELYQLLERFTHAEYLSVFQLVDNINLLHSKKFNSNDSIQVLPRIVFEQDIVLQRKAWLVDRDSIPDRQANDSDWDYYRRLSNWRKENELPEEFFVTITSRDHLFNSKKKESSNLSKDDYKPQYINLQNIFTINLFAKLVAKTPEKIRITEMVPCSDQMLKIDDKPYVSECVVEWSS